MASPSELRFLKKSFDPANLALGQDLLICDLVLPRDVANRSKLFHMKSIQSLDLVSIWSPSFTAVCQRWNDDGTIDINFGGKCNVMATPQPIFLAFQKLGLPLISVN